MSQISENLKYLRKNIGLTQEQMSQQVGIKRSLLGAYEEGRADPRISNLLKFAEIFELSVDDLISSDLSKPNKKPSKNHEQSNDLRVLSITVDKNDRENIELVPQKAAAGYLNGYSDLEYMEKLPKFHLPLLPDNTTYRAFEINGDSMLPLRSGTIVIGKYMEDIHDIKNGKTYVLLTKDEGVVYKRIFKYADTQNIFCLTSDNRQYSSYDVKKQDIIEIWEASAFISMEFPEVSSNEDMTLNKLANIVMDLQQEVIRLKKR